MCRMFQILSAFFGSGNGRLCPWGKEQGLSDGRPEWSHRALPAPLRLGARDLISPCCSAFSSVKQACDRVCLMVAALSINKAKQFCAP